MLFMVIETFEEHNLIRVRDRFQTKGRLMPDELNYVSSWMTSDGTKCFQLMETATVELLNAWVSNWNDIVSFEIVQIETSSEFWDRFSLSNL
ncbi:MAG: DUF3303 family protein [Armatimonadota bacterium]